MIIDIETNSRYLKYGGPNAIEWWEKQIALSLMQPFPNSILPCQIVPSRK